MLRTLLIATALLTASGSALAHGDYGYGRVVTVEPRFVISFGVRQPDGFSVLYESGGSRYWTYSPYRPGPTIVLPPPYRIHHYRDYRAGWDGRRDWDDRRDDWHDDRRDYREHRRHGHHGRD